MKKTIISTVRALLVVPVLALGVASVLPAVGAGAVTDLSISGGANSAKGTDQTGCLFGTTAEACGSSAIFQTVTDVLLFVIGAISVIMLIIGGIRYTVSGGDSSAVTSAKNTILYAIVGIVVAILAYAVVHFVISSFATP